MQLIFVLLHCSMAPEREPFLKNFLKTSNIDKSVDKKLLAKIDIWDDDSLVGIEFFYHSNLYLNRMLGKDENRDQIKYSFSALEKLEEIKSKFQELETLRSRLEKCRESLDDYKKIDDGKRHKRNLEDFFLYVEPDQDIKIWLEKFSQITTFEEFETKIDQLTEENIKRIVISKHGFNSISSILKKVSDYLQSKKLLLITTFSTGTDKDEEAALLCHIPGLSIEDIESFLKRLSDKIFLAAPSTQVFLFLSQEDRNLLFKRRSDNSSNSYHVRLADAKSEMPGLFTYDFFDVELLVKSFLAARDKDFKEATEKGEYGTSYTTLLADFNSMLIDIKLSLEPDLSGVVFKMDEENEAAELRPEDLSHGELKRLCIYIWLRYHEVKDAIILMDEIEVALHPDGQYQMVADLMQWTPESQYILATHSYELCQAVTPAHVKELEPGLLKKASN